MNIDSIKNYPTGSNARLKHRDNVLEYKQKSADLCENKNVNRGYYSGSFTGINVAAVAGSINPSKSSSLLDNILTLCDKHTVIAQNLVALFLAAGLRPIAIMSLPGKKDKEDKIYASGHSIASGLIGFGFSSIVMYPLGAGVEYTKKTIKNAAAAMKALSKNTELTKEELELVNNIKKKYNVSNLKELEEVKVFKKLKSIYKVNSLEELEHSKTFKNVTKMLDMAPDVFLFGVLKAMLTVALIPPILKYVFGIEKKKAPVQAQQTPPPAPTIAKPEIEKFAGGLK